VTAPDDHLDLDAAAAFEEGLDEDGSIGAHVASCDECSQRVAQVRTTRALLSALPDETMPADVATRIREALPREPATNTIVPAVSRRRRWTSSPALAGLIAAAAAIALVAAISIGSLRSSGHHANSGAAAGSAAAPLAPSTNFPVLASGVHYSDGNEKSLVAQLDQLVRTPATLSPTTAAAPAQSRAAEKDTLTTLSAHGPVPNQLRGLFGNRQAILACARLLAGGPVTPLAVDFARFTGGARHLRNAPAMVVLLPASGALPDAAFIVGPKCTSDGSQDLYTFVQGPAR
jgi:hypothetical protein